MKRAYTIIFLILVVAIILSSAVFLLKSDNIAVFNPKGTIAMQERNLIGMSIALMLIIVIPVYVLLFTFALKYRAGNTKAEYNPDSKTNLKQELLWWILPFIIVIFLGTLTWKKTHELDPFKPLDYNIKPLTIQVVALRWKWLFIYPDQNIATVNFIEFPEHIPIHFELTADDAPMNSFWIPQLSGQIYAMSGMSTQLNLMADETGEFRGSAAEISGPGFAGMNFIAKSSVQNEFDQWVAGVRQSGNVLSAEEYNKLLIPSENNPPAYFVSPEKDLYNTIINKYMGPPKISDHE